MTAWSALPWTGHEMLSNRTSDPDGWEEECAKNPLLLLEVEGVSPGSSKCHCRQ